MEKFINGDVVVLPFPFTDLSSTRKRPALILTDIAGNDFIMLQITSKNVKDTYAIPLTGSDFSSGSLNQNSNIRPNKIILIFQIICFFFRNSCNLLPLFPHPCNTRQTQRNGKHFSIQTSKYFPAHLPGQFFDNRKPKPGRLAAPGNICRIKAIEYMTNICRLNAICLI